MTDALYPDSSDNSNYYTQNTIASSLTNIGRKISSIKLSDNTYEIDFSGGSLSSNQNGQKIIYLLAAELCYQETYDNFIILDSEKKDNLYTYKQTDTEKVKTARVRDQNSKSKTVIYHETVPGGYRTISKPSATSIIKCVNVSDTAPEDIVFENATIIKSVSEHFYKQTHMKARYPELLE